MDISSYFEPIDISKIGYKRGNFVPRVGDLVTSYNKEGGRFPVIDGQYVEIYNAGVIFTTPTGSSLTFK